MVLVNLNNLILWKCRLGETGLNPVRCRRCNTENASYATRKGKAKLFEEVKSEYPACVLHQNSTRHGGCVNNLEVRHAYFCVF